MDMFGIIDGLGITGQEQNKPHKIEYVFHVFILTKNPNSFLAIPQ
jgi:hypothetical protein